MEKRILIIGLIFLFVFSSVVPVSIGFETKQSDNKEQLSNRGNILYVGGSGPNNYTKIQDAIDNAVDGDTVFVYDDSSPYNESFWIDKSIQLIGENKITTILNATWQANIRVWAPQVLITEFTLLNHHENYDSYGVDAFESEYFTFKNNIVIGCDYGLQLSYFSNCTIENNEIIDGTVGIDTYHIFTSTFANNKFIDNKCGIELDNARSNILSNNTFINNGVYLVGYAYPNTFFGNIVNGKSLLYLENQHDLIIDNISAGQIVLIGCKNITIKNIELSNASYGIEIICSDNCLITNTKLYSNYYAGVAFLEKCNNNMITNNDIMFNFFGIMMYVYSFPFEFNSIIGNKIRYNYHGIGIQGSNNTIKDNIIENNNQGIEVSWPGLQTVITNNIIANSTTIGLYLYDTSWCLIKSNNFINNQNHASFEKYSLLRNYFRNNYWDNLVGFGPKPIWGLQHIVIGHDSDGFPIHISIPWLQFDWHPAKEPYNIGL